MRLNRYITLPESWEDFWPKMKANIEAQRQRELNCSDHDFFFNTFVEIVDNTGMNLAKHSYARLAEPLGQICSLCRRFKPNEARD